MAQYWQPKPYEFYRPDCGIRSGVKFTLHFKISFPSPIQIWGKRKLTQDLRIGATSPYIHSGSRWPDQSNRALIHQYNLFPFGIPGFRNVVLFLPLDLPECGYQWNQEIVRPSVFLPSWLQMKSIDYNFITIREDVDRIVRLATSAI
jgi:hypothetical protein